MPNRKLSKNVNLGKIRRSNFLGGVMINRQCIRQEFLQRKLTKLTRFLRNGMRLILHASYHASHRPDDGTDTRTRVV